MKLHTIVTDKRRVQIMLEVLHVNATLDGLEMEHIAGVRKTH